MKMMDEIIVKYENQLLTFKSENKKLRDNLTREENKAKELIPQYRDAINRLRKNMHMLKDKLTELHQEKTQEKSKFESMVINKFQFLTGKLQELKGILNEAQKENHSLNLNNQRLNMKILENEDTISEKDVRILSLLFNHLKE
jgi:chromosome segregation ATPase